MNHCGLVFYFESTMKSFQFRTYRFPSILIISHIIQYTILQDTDEQQNTEAQSYHFIKMAVFWVVVPQSLVEFYQRYIHHQGYHL
jgi:hypothetical protein